MRKIQTQDVFKLARIIKSAKLKGEVAEIITKINTEEKDNNLSKNVGVQIFFAIVEGCADEKTEEKIYDLIGGIAEISAEDIKKQSLDATVDIIKKISEENDIMAFFNQAGSLQ
jgi:hypothetical protein